MLIALSIFAFDRIMDATHTDLDEANEAYSKSVEEYKGVQDELNKVDSQLEYYKSLTDKNNKPQDENDETYSKSYEYTYNWDIPKNK